MKHHEMSFFVDQYLLNHVKETDHILDLTLGNGNDTIKVSPLCHFVTGFDIQSEAVNRSREKIESLGLTNVNLICDSHLNYGLYVKDPNGAIFNLGYLPNGDKTITTKKEVTIETIKSLLLLNSIRFIIISCYPGHPEGKLESDLITDHLKTLEKPFNTSIYQMLNKKDAPFVVLIEK